MSDINYEQYLKSIEQLMHNNDNNNDNNFI